MIDIPVRLFPPALLAGIIIYGATTFLWLQPLVEQRMAQKQLIPWCETSLHKAELDAPVPRNPERAKKKLMIDILKGTGMGDLPGMNEIIGAAEDMLDASKPRRFRSSRLTRNSVCSCAVDEAFAQSGFAMTLHVASARTHTPASIKKLPSTIQSIVRSGICGASIINNNNQ